MATHLHNTKYQGNRRNGNYHRSLHTSCGTLPLCVPRDRAGLFNTEHFAKWQRTLMGVKQTASRLFDEGLSYRDIASFLIKTGVSLGYRTYANYREKRIFVTETKITEYPFIFFDGLHFGKKKVLLIALGVKENGVRHILSVSFAKRESTASWETLLSTIASATPRIVCIDGLVGLGEMIRLYFPYAKVQRCRFHYLRNIWTVTPKHLRREVMKEARLAVSASSMEEAALQFEQLQKKYAQYKKLAAILQFPPELFTICQLPEELQSCFRTTNWIERLNRFLRESMAPHNISSNNESLLLDIISFVQKEYEEKFSLPDKRFLQHKEWLQSWLFVPPQPQGNL